ncbi:MAG: hypothetical protein MUO64_19140 [Anaerolineales bacterium]|nr:hypothetical protein [Anaerolineales bacterium]
MSKEQAQTQETSSEPSKAPGGNWEEVGQQFQALGESLAAAFRTAWENEENRQQMQNMKAGLEQMVNQVSQAIKDSAASPAGQQVRGEAKKVASTLRTAGEQTAQEVRPHLLTALRQIEEELQKLINRMEQQAEPAVKTPEGEASAEEAKPG